MDISKYLNEAIKAKGITQKTLADRLCMAPAYLNKLCKGTKNPSIELLDRICQALGMTPSEFFSCASDAPSMRLKKNEIRLVNDFRGLYDYEREVVSEMVGSLRKKHLSTLNEHSDPQQVMRSVDGYAAAGQPLFNSGDHEPIQIPEKYSDPNRFRIIVAKGDSMFPKIHNGDIVIARKGTTASPGSTALVLLESVNSEGEYTLKNIYIYGDRVELRSVNQQYPTMVYPLSSIISAEEIAEIIHR